MEEDEVFNVLERFKSSKKNFYDIRKQKVKQKKQTSTKVVMPVGLYAGVEVKKLPLSYCRWIVSQKFSSDILKIAKKKVDASPHSNHLVSVSRHATDQFSLRFMDLWLDLKGKSKIGLGTFIADLAEQAWKDGHNISKNRYAGDGVIIEYKGMKFVFNQSETMPEYKDLITIM